MTTRREWLVSKGLAKEGRGKFSGDALKALDSARLEGIKFSDDEPKPAPVKREKPTNSVPKESVGIISDIRYTFPEDMYIAREKVSKKVRSMREVCNLCRVSLVGHICENPMIVATDGRGSVSVVIEKRK